MKQVSSTDFRKVYNHEHEPVEVTAYGGKLVGTWYPAGTHPPEAPQPITEAAAETGPQPEQRMTIRPAHGPRPVMTTTTKPIPDPVELRRLERERYSELQSRLYGPRKKGVQ